MSKEKILEATARLLLATTRGKKPNGTQLREPSIYTFNDMHSRCERRGFNNIMRTVRKVIVDVHLGQYGVPSINTVASLAVAYLGIGNCGELAMHAAFMLRKTAQLGLLQVFRIFGERAPGLDENHAFVVMGDMASFKAEPISKLATARHADQYYVIDLLLDYAGPMTRYYNQCSSYYKKCMRNPAILDRQTWKGIDEKRFQEIDDRAQWCLINSIPRILQSLNPSLRLNEAGETLGRTKIYKHLTSKMEQWQLSSVINGFIKEEQPKEADPSATPGVM